MTEFEYEYYLATQKRPNMNTNILISFPIMTEYKYLSVSQKWLNTIYKYKFCWASQMEGLQDQFWVSQGDAKFAESPDDWS